MKVIKTDELHRFEKDKKDFRIFLQLHGDIELVIMTCYSSDHVMSVSFVRFSFSG